MGRAKQPYVSKSLKLKVSDLIQKKLLDFFFSAVTGIVQDTSFSMKPIARRVVLHRNNASAAFWFLEFICIKL